MPCDGIPCDGIALGAFGWIAIGADDVIPLPQPSVSPGAFGNGSALVGTGLDEAVGLFSACTAGAFDVSGRAAKIAELGAGAAG